MKKLIAESHARCVANGLVPKINPQANHYLTEDELNALRGKYEGILSVIRIFGERTIRLMSGTGIVIMVTDDSAHIIDSLGDAEMLSNLRQLNIREGMEFDEVYSGTNAINMALSTNKPIHLSGTDHFHEVLFGTSCCSVPFSFGGTNPISGTITLMTALENRSNYQLALLVNMVESIGREILLRRTNRQQYLLNQFMIAGSDNAIIITEANGTIVDFNESAAKLLRISADEAMGTSSMFLPEIGSIASEVILNGAKFINHEMSINHGIDQKFFCLVDAVEIVDGSRGVIGSYIQIKDISERHLLENKIITSEKLSAIGKLAAGIAHEIRNPLTSITGFVQLMIKNGVYNSSYLEIIDGELGRMRKLITDFVNASKPSSPERRWRNVHELVEDTAAIMNSQALMSGTHLKVTLGENSDVFIDYNQVKQVLINIIQNSIEAIGDNEGEVHIFTECSEESKQCRISVVDSGPGMSQEQLKQISNPFFTTKDNGVGLGLYVCYRIIESHGGHIEVTSEIGTGTRFDLVLPL